MIDDNQHDKVHAALSNMSDGDVLIYLAGSSQLLVIQADELVLMEVQAGTLIRRPADDECTDEDDSQNVGGTKPARA